MATFGKRVPPKHRADPNDRKRASAPASRPGGAHAAPVVPEVTASEPAPAAAQVLATTPAPAPAVEVADAPPAPRVPAPVQSAPAAPAPVQSAPAAAAPVPAAPESPAPASVAPEPAAPAPVARAETPPARHAGPAAEPRTLRVLVVDDNEDVRGLLRIAFARAQMEVVGTAIDSREALALAQHEQPDIVLLDVNLPEVPGLDVLPVLQEHCPRVVMFSAQCGAAVVETALERGAVGFIEKGVSMKSVIAYLREVATAPEGKPVEPFPLGIYR